MVVLDYFGVFVSHRWRGIARESWPYILALVPILAVGAAFWQRCEESLLHLFQGDSTHEKRLRKRVFEVLVLVICIFAAVCWWTGR